MKKWFENIKTRRLIKKSLDNTLSEKEQEELARLLSNNHALKHYHDTLHAVDKGLKSIAFEKENTDVSEEVMNKVKNAKAHDEFYRFPGNRKAGAFYSGPVKYAMAAAIGLLIGIGSMMLISQNNMVSTDQIYGTLLSNKLAKGVAYSETNTHIRMIPYSQKDLLYLNFFTNTQQAYDISVEFHPEDYIPIDQQSNAARMKDVRFDTNHVSFSCIDQTSAQIVFRKKTQTPTNPLIIKASKNGTEIFSKKISP